MLLAPVGLLSILLPSRPFLFRPLARKVWNRQKARFHIPRSEVAQWDMAHSCIDVAGVVVLVSDGFFAHCTITADVNVAIDVFADWRAA